MSISSISSGGDLWIDLFTSQASACNDVLTLGEADEAASSSTSQNKDFVKQLFSDVSSSNSETVSNEELLSKVKSSMELLSKLHDSSSQITMFEARNQNAPDFSAMASNIIDSADTDDDSLLSQKESGLNEDIFLQIDSNGDGTLTADEITNGLKNMHPHPSPPPPPPPPPQDDSSSSSDTFSSIFIQFDTDGDGIVSEAELILGLEKMNNPLKSLLDITDSSDDDSSSNTAVSDNNILSRLNAIA